MEHFNKIAKKLAKNPLGIIALFLVLIYSIACLTFSFSKNLDTSLVQYFVGFILVYPLIILVVFYRLVTKHHTKLYAPEDFIIPEHFIECVYGDQAREMTRKQKIAEIATEPKIQIEGENL